MITNPNLLIRGEKGQIEMQKNVKMESLGPKSRPKVNINLEKKFGYSKDTPFTSDYIRYN